MIWALTSVITVGSAAYQRLTGPTYPIRSSVEIGGVPIKYKLLTSHYSTSDAPIVIGPADESLSGEIRWRRLKSLDRWKVSELAREGGRLVAAIPKQPPAGRIAYSITLIDNNGARYPLSSEPVTIRFKGEVPVAVMALHIIAMFISMLLGTRAGMEAVFDRNRSYRFTIWTVGLFVFGGIFFGPVVQKYAFGSYWTGWPLGSDLTDNKTAVALLGWLAALWRGRKPGTGRKWFIIAAGLQLLVFLIPHSLFGSELDYTQMDPQQ